MSATIETDYLVIGSGLAGLTFALRAAQHGSVTILTKMTSRDANSSWAQGGIAGVLSEDDSFELHKQDTLVAGAGLCHPDAVDILVREGPERIRDLIALGAQFNTEMGAGGHEVLSLGREGGHSRNRIVHTADYTGWECERALLAAVSQNSSICTVEHAFALDLALSGEAGRCVGAWAMDSASGESTLFTARATLVATGGCGQVYKHTTNPVVATGDGVAMAWRAGAAIANMEFIQFHPTTLYHPKARAFLITEALRGEGGILQTSHGERFMPGYHKLAELAPRDVVARAIVTEMERTGEPCVYLDVSHLDAEMLRTHFPTVYERCLSVGIDITKSPIPVAPAQHYQCGGIQTDLSAATTIRGLYAAGEVACTGVHGANRLASNSLLEAMVFGRRAANHARRAELHPSRPESSGPPLAALAHGQAEESRTREALGRIRAAMQRHVGIVRSTRGLLQAREEVAATGEELLRGASASPAALEARNIACVAELIVESALHRHESRGLHYTVDYPAAVESERHDTVITPA